MNSIVIELQRDALDREVLVADLLRSALVVARKLGLAEFQGWIEKEAEGYADGDEIPNYRLVTGKVRAFNPNQGWIPVVFRDTLDAEILSQRRLGVSIAEIENVLATAADAHLHVPLPHEFQRRLLEQHEFRESEVSLFIPHSGLARIVDRVRTAILDWSLRLEEQGVLGEDLTFTARERQQAQAQAQNVTNIFSPVERLQVQQGTHDSIQVQSSEFDPAAVRTVLAEVRRQLDSLGLDPEAKAEAQAELDTLGSQLRSPRPKREILREGLRSLRNLLENAGGTVAGQLALELGRLLS